MNIRDLTYINLVAKYCSFGKAAKMAYVSQPALSMQIKKIEEELGVIIFERNNKEVLVTNSGKEIVRIAREMLEKYDSMKEVAKLAGDPMIGDIKIGAFPTLAPYVFPKIVPKIIKKYPDLKLYLVEEKTDILIEQLAKGEIDVALLALPIMEEKFEVKYLFSDDFYLAVPNSHKFAKKKLIAQEDLDDEILLLLQDGHCLRDQALNLCQTVGAIESSGYRASSLETLRQMVIAGIGMTLIPEIALDESKNLTYIKFKNPKPNRDIALVWRKSSSRKICFENLEKLIKGIL